MEISQLHQLYLKSSGICTDTRNINPGSIFFALKGANFDANSFAAEALEKGAAYAVIDNEEFLVSEKYILAEDALQTLQNLSNYHRKSLNILIIGLTGSNGKTTTKELINAVLSTKFKTTATKGNLNNHIGVPLTLLSMDKSTEIGIVEMGANHHGEIDFLCRIAEPDFGYITNFGKAHLEGFGSLEGVKKAKTELYRFLKEKNKTIFLNKDDETQAMHLDYQNNFSFSEKPGANIVYKKLVPDPFVEIEYVENRIKTKLIGNYNATNVAAALTIGNYFKVPLENSMEALAEYEPKNNRSQIIEKNSNKIILDAYNANPTSMKAALESFETLKSDKKIIILGDMFELGNNAHEEHQSIADLLINMKFEKAFLVGSNFFNIEKTDPRITKHKELNELRQFFSLEKTENSLILIKGSRGMAMEKILE